MNRVRGAAHRVRGWLSNVTEGEEVISRLPRIETGLESNGRDTVSSKLSQLVLIAHYRELARSANHGLRFEEVEFRAFSQNGEDGILLYLFALLGSGARRVVEICAGDGIECNSANLLVNHGWNGLLFDGNSANIARGRQFLPGVYRALTI